MSPQLAPSQRSAQGVTGLQWFLCGLWWWEQAVDLSGPGEECQQWQEAMQRVYTPEPSLSGVAVKHLHQPSEGAVDSARVGAGEAGGRLGGSEARGS